MTSAQIQKIALFGNGLAGLMCAAKLIRVLPESIQLTYIEPVDGFGQKDLFFGTITPPETYDFLLGLDISEPDFLPKTKASFSVGTQYKDWGPETRNWVQSFHRPLPVFNGVELHHYLARLNTKTSQSHDIADYIMSTQAAKAGVFAHPPEGKKIPLAEVEYGYHVRPEDWRQMLEAKIKNGSLQCLKADIIEVLKDKYGIKSVVLSNSQTLQADFFINALGPTSKFSSEESFASLEAPKIKAVEAFSPHQGPMKVCRKITAKSYGWQSETPLKGGTHYLTIYAPDSETEALKDSPEPASKPELMPLGHIQSPWNDNCLSIGHAAAVLEPLTPAPLLLLQRDISRLAELLPVTTDMRIESREYNRRFKDDYDHATLFTRAFFVSSKTQNSEYWAAATEAPLQSKLKRKINQFESRGISVQYDYEPFSARDWTLQHLGMGRRPERYDPLADAFPEEQLENTLSQIKTAINVMAQKMPPHHVYMAGLLKYLKEKHG